VVLLERLSIPTLLHVTLILMQMPQVLTLTRTTRCTSSAKEGILRAWIK